MYLEDARERAEAMDPSILPLFFLQQHAVDEYFLHNIAISLGHHLHNISHADSHPTS